MVVMITEGEKGTGGRKVWSEGDRSTVSYWRRQHHRSSETMQQSTAARTHSRFREPLSLSLSLSLSHTHTHTHTRARARCSDNTQTRTPRHRHTDTVTLTEPHLRHLRQQPLKHYAPVVLLLCAQLLLRWAYVRLRTTCGHTMRSLWGRTHRRGKCTGRHAAHHWASMERERQRGSSGTASASTATPPHRHTATPRHRDTATPRHRDTATPRNSHT